MGTARSIDLAELNDIVERRGVSTVLNWRVRPREPRVGYGFGCLPARRVETPQVSGSTILGGGQQLTTEGQATIEGDGGFRGGDTPRVRIATRSDSNYDVFRVRSTVKPDLSVDFVDLASVDAVADRIVEFHHRCVAEFEQHVQWATEQLTASHTRLGSVLDAMFEGNDLGL